MANLCELSKKVSKYLALKYRQNRVQACFKNNPTPKYARMLDIMILRAYLEASYKVFVDHRRRRVTSKPHEWVQRTLTRIYWNLFLFQFKGFRLSFQFEFSKPNLARRTKVIVSIVSMLKPLILILVFWISRSLFIVEIARERAHVTSQLSAVA